MQNGCARVLGVDFYYDWVEVLKFKTRCIARNTVLRPFSHPGVVKNGLIGNLSQAQELQEEQDAVYEAKHNAKEGSRKMFKKAPSKKPVVSKAKKPDVQVAEADSTLGKNIPLAPIFNRVGTKSKQLSFFLKTFLQLHVYL